MTDERHIVPVIGAKCDAHSVDAVIAALAAQQHGRVARWQLLYMGLGRRAIQHRVEQGRLHVEWPGVYAVGHPTKTPEGRWIAAVLTGGPGAVLSHRSAAMLWRIRRTDRTAIEVTSSTHRRPLPGIERHRSELPADEVTIHRGIPVTTVARTFFDLAAVLNPRQLARAANEAEILRLWDSAALNTVVERHPRRRGVRALRELTTDTTVTREELEKRFREFLDEYDVPRPEFNAYVEVGGRSYEIDCLWRAERLAVELDGRATHGTRAAFENDRARDRVLQVAGLRTVRVTWRQLHGSAAGLAADLRALLRLARTRAG